MVRILILVLTIICCSSCTKMEVATSTLLVADWAQTRQIAKNPGRYAEGSNWFLSDHPDVNNVDNYFAGAVVANSILNRYLPERYLPYYQAGLISIQVDKVVGNYKIGLQVKF